MESNLAIPQKFNIGLPHDPAIPLLYTQKHWKQVLKYLLMNVNSSTVHNSQKVETTQMLINGWMDK